MVAGLPKLRTVSIDGPYNVHGLSEGPSRKLLFVCHPAREHPSRVAAKSAPGASPDETTCASRSSRISRAARIGVRSRPADVEAPMSFYKRSRQSGGSFDDGIRAGVARVLSSPYFLYRIESDPPGARAGVAHPVSDVELASRLSFFLWSSIPDEKLLDLAAAGRLREPEVLSAQVHRMLADDRSDALVNNFTGQWLQLRNLEAKVVPDIADVPRFRRQHPQRIPHRDRDVLRLHFARRPQRSGASERGLHLRRRAARQALRHQGRLRPAIPAREAHRSQSPRSAGARKHPRR